MLPLLLGALRLIPLLVLLQPTGDTATVFKRAPDGGRLVIGVSTIDVDGALATQLGLEVGAALTVVELSPGLPAADVLALHDVIVAVDGRSPVTRSVLGECIAAHAEGEPVALRVLRGGAELELEVPVARLSDDGTERARIDPFFAGAERHAFDTERLAELALRGADGARSAELATELAARMAAEVKAQLAQVKQQSEQGHQGLLAYDAAMKAMLEAQRAREREVAVGDGAAEAEVARAKAMYAEALAAFEQVRAGSDRREDALRDVERKLAEMSEKAAAQRVPMSLLGKVGEGRALVVPQGHYPWGGAGGDLSAVEQRLAGIEERLARIEKLLVASSDAVR